MPSIKSPLSSTSRLTIWFVSVSFVLFQFFLQLSSGVIIYSIMTEMKLSGFITGLLSSSFYYVYTSLQIPVGVLFDKKNTRNLLTWSAILCSVGCFLFAHSYTVPQLIITRLIIGTGSSFAFIGLSQTLRQHFPIRQFTFMIGLSETLGFLVTMLGMISLGHFVSLWGWRVFMEGAGCAGLIIAISCWIVIPIQSIAPRPHQQSTLQNLVLIITNPISWINGLFVALGFTMITVFAAMWAVPFLQIKLHCSLNVASTLDAMLFLGAALSCPILGYFAGAAKKRTPLLVGSSIITALLLLVLIYTPIHNLIWCGLLLFLIGLCCGSYMVAYSIANEIAPIDAQSTATGFANTLATLSPLIQPVIGRFIDALDAITPHQSLQHYQYALTIIPLGLFLSSILALYLPEKKA